MKLNMRMTNCVSNQKSLFPQLKNSCFWYENVDNKHVLPR